MLIINNNNLNKNNKLLTCYMIFLSSVILSFAWSHSWSLTFTFSSRLLLASSRRPFFLQQTKRTKSMLEEQQQQQQASRLSGCCLIDLLCLCSPPVFDWPGSRPGLERKTPSCRPSLRPSCLVWLPSSTNFRGLVGWSEKFYLMGNNFSNWGLFLFRIIEFI